MKSPNPSKQTKVRRTLKMIAGNMKRFMSRVTAAKLATKKLLGTVPEGSGNYRTVCPKGAGQGPIRHEMSDRILVGSRSAHRRSVRFIKQMKFTKWGKQLTK